MLDTKVEFILNRMPEIQHKIMSKYIKNLDMYGKQGPTLGFTVDMYAYCLSLPEMGYNLKLELYKKLSTLLRETNILTVIPQTIIPVAGTSSPIYYGTGERDMLSVNIQALFNIDIAPKETKSYYFTAVEQMFIVAYPKSYGLLSRIEDRNSFVITSAWTVREAVFTVNSVSVDYYVYEMKLMTTLTNFLNRFYFGA